MPYSPLLSLAAGNKHLVALCRLLDHNEPLVQVGGLCGSSLALYFAAAASSGLLPARPYLFVANDEEAAGYVFQDLRTLLGGEEALHLLPSSFRRQARYGQHDTAAEILRADALKQLVEYADAKAADTHTQRPLIVVTHAAALAERVPNGHSLSLHTIHLHEHDVSDLSLLARRLETMGFRRQDYVYEPGDFAVRGSLLDVYSYADELPLRIDFLGDEIDSIRTFHIDTQLSHERCSRAAIVAAPHEAKDAVPLTALLPSHTVLVAHDFNYCLDTIEKVYSEGFSRQAHEAADADTAPLSREALLCSREEIAPALGALQRVELLVAAPPKADKRSTAIVTFHTAPQPVYHKNYDLLRSSFADYTERGYHIFLLADSSKQHERLAAILAEQAREERTASFTPLAPTLHEGFSDADLSLCLFTDHQIFDRYHKYTLRSDVARQGKMALTLKELKSFQYGDYVVHIDHGVGQFGGLVRMPAPDGKMHEVMKILYKDGDAVYVSIHALHKVSKYRSSHGTPPTISRLGTGAWQRLKEKTKKKLKDIARDLIRLYSQRREAQGFAFSADSYLQHELEASFTYEDTPDQLRVTQEVKHDMESRRPMDRLVCGDVGFGKTEIAIRAAFKAACDGKQTAVLVPTTPLALQHYRTFSERLAEMPVRVDYLTRARTPKQTKEILQSLADGKIDILIGTHRLTGKQVKFKDLGLLVIDEEQKFGVGVKEKLRTLKVNIDTLTLSATPIPRTLQFSLMGARDFSVLQTPPPNRRPIHTELHSFSHEVIAEAVDFELSRGGQVFIVTNRIGALENLARLVEKYVPKVRVAIGHGQMPAEQLEKVIVGFIEGQADVLISTTIVENGIDIPNANTIIIDAAHTFGLSDLHQMRGRVGRSNRKAFCYLLAPPTSLLKDDARRRLEAVATFNDLGSGISIAMQDLEIRGAGNMLGAEQSGFMAEMGYETYQKILSQAVSELRNEEEFVETFTPEDSETTPVSAHRFVDETNVETDAQAFLPETYVPGAAERMLLYRELSSTATDGAAEAFRLRLIDRFGPLPPEAEELLCCAALRRCGPQIGAERMALHNDRLIVYFVSNADSPFYHSPAFDRVIDYAMTHADEVRLEEKALRRRMAVSHVSNAKSALRIVKEILAG